MKPLVKVAFVRSLTFRLIVPLVLVATLISATLVIIGTRQSDKRALKQIERNGQHLATALQFFIEIDPQESSLVRLVNSLGGEKNIELVLVLSDAPYKVLACSQNGLIGSHLEDVSDPFLVQKLRDHLHDKNPELKPGQSTNTYDYFCQIRYYDTTNRHRNWLVLISLQNTENLFWQQTGQFIGLAASFGLLLFGAWILFRQVIQKPVWQMLQAMEMRRQGDVLARSPVTSMDELGVLSNHYNHTLEALSQTEERFQQLANNTDDVFWIIDLEENRVLYVNPAYERVWGRSPQSLLEDSDSWLKSIIADDRPRVEHIWKKAILSGTSFSMEYRIRNEQDKLLWIHDNGLPIPNAKGEIYRLVGIARNITKQKNVEREYIHAREEAESLVIARSQFLANMSHEIRTPINGILGASRLILESDLDKDQRELSNMIHESCCALITIINDILDFSKIEAGKLKMESISFELGSVIHEVSRLLEHNALEKGLALNVTYPEQDGVYLLGDPLRIRQILLNLISNALKFTAKGSVTINASSKIEKDNQYQVRVEVTDTGIGIARGKNHLIFAEFSQADGSTSRQFGGTGLGLAISRHLAHLMGGDITFISEQGVGSTFILEIVLAQTTKCSLAKRLEPIGHKRCYNKRILLVEDRIINQKVAQRMLVKLGLQVDLAENGEIGLGMVTQQSYDMILMDVQMPIMDGLEATRKIREQKLSKAPILAMTANAMVEDRSACLEAGMDGFMSKPIILESLIKELDNWF